MPIQNKSVPDDRRSGEMKPEDVKYAASASEDIRKDLVSLQSDVAHLAADVKRAGSDKARDAITYVNEHIGSLKDTGTNTFEKIESHIKSKPGQSVTLAFITGLLASYLFNRRSS